MKFSLKVTATVSGYIPLKLLQSICPLMEMARSFQTVYTDNFQFVRWKDVGVIDKLLSVNETDASHMKHHCFSAPFIISVLSYPD